MHIRSLTIRNFKAIKNVDLQGLEQMVLIAGPNGCGKSCIFDAIKLLKSCYGGYQPNEWQTWFSEAQINIGSSSHQLTPLFRDPHKPISIEASFAFSPAELEYISLNIESIARRSAWNVIAPHTQGSRIRAYAQDIRQYGPAVDALTAQTVTTVKSQLGQALHVGTVSVSPFGDIETAESPFLELIFGSYEPRHIGIIDYHSANRVYGREQVGGINLNLESAEEIKKQSSLYNTANKYTNIKSEMAAGYVRDLILKDRGLPGFERDTLGATLTELFSTFFPDKKFGGAVPTEDGAVSFPVTSEDGVSHDINELSSGEKEVLFGYLRLRNSSPRNSVVLLDEPEMHLNPALIKGLPQFYQKNLGLALGNQIWLVTHSDAFLREAAGQTGYGIYHMQHGAVSNDENQVSRVRMEEELDRAVLDLVGDLASYQPGGRVVIFEGENSEFDRKMVSRLFPELEKRANLISVGSKSNAKKLHELLEKASATGRKMPKFYTIVDSDGARSREVAQLFQWPRYHIENYLLEPEFRL